MNTMTKVFTLTDRRSLGRTELPVGSVPTAGMPILDAHARPLRDLRISVTDRCNFRCTYCMPRDAFSSDHVFLPHSQLLSFEEIARSARVFVQMGVNKIRLTGGEPLLRKNIEVLIAMLAELRTPSGEPLDLTLTTNGSLLRQKARALKEAGLTRVTVSLDAIDEAKFTLMSDSRFTAADVLRGIDAAADAGLMPVKVNMVVRRGVNDDQVLPMARHFRHTPHVLRFIEYMDVGNTNGWNLREVLQSDELLARLRTEFDLQPVAQDRMGRVAETWTYADGAGEIGVISSVSHAFCGGCTRARLSPEGKLFLCLFASEGHDLRALLRDGADDARLASALAGIWQRRTDNYSERRAAAGSRRSDQPDKIEMSYIGG
jgi:cyclic pyranopterin phosphate synthase